MDELVDILDKNGMPTGTSALKSEVHKKGLYHQTVHVWLYTKDRQLLLQQRGKDKATFPLLWDISVAGHITAGEEVSLGALREVEEEIGLHLTKNQLQKIGVNKSHFIHNQSFIDNEFNHVFIAELEVKMDVLSLQKEEVEALQLITVQEYSDQIKNKNPHFVPIAEDYLQMLCKAIDERLTV